MKTVIIIYRFMGIKLKPLLFQTTYREIKGKVKFSRYRPCVAQRVGRGIALLFHDSGTRRG
jgi:hypothetical protein